MNAAECGMPAVWFPTIRAGTGTDVFTQRLCDGLNDRGLRAEISWLPHRSEYAPWSVRSLRAPDWANIVHVNTWMHSRFLPVGVPVVATVHHAVHHPDATAYKSWLRSIYHARWIAPNERHIMRRAQRVVAVSRFVADVARETLVDVEMQIICNGIDTQRLRPADARSNQHRPFRLLYVGSWMARKGVDMLARIMRALGDDFILHYTGGGGANRDKREMPRNMLDVGRLNADEVLAAMQQADAFLFPSRSEGLPLALMEALACGLPAIASSAASMPEVVEDGVSGVLCPRDNVAAFVAGVRRLAADPDLLESMRLAAAASMARRFDLTRMVDAYVASYRAVLDVAR